MGTQGLVTIVSKNDGTVLLKAVTGMDGDRAKLLARELKKRWPLSLKEAHAIAKEVEFGPPESLVVFTREEACFDHDDEQLPVEELPEDCKLYRATFDKPRFNPRWERGTADYVVVVRV
jgi:hypothetical protein